MQVPLATYKIEAQRNKETGILVNIWLKVKLANGFSQTVAWTYGKEIKPSALTTEGMMQYGIYDGNGILRAMYWAHDIEITEV